MKNHAVNNRRSISVQRKIDRARIVKYSGLNTFVLRRGEWSHSDGWKGAIGGMYEQFRTFSSPNSTFRCGVRLRVAANRFVATAFRLCCLNGPNGTPD